MRGAGEADGRTAAPPLRLRVLVGVALLVALGIVGLTVEQRLDATKKPPPPPTAWPTVVLGSKVVEYKQSEKRPLHLHLYLPAAAPTGAIIFFHGGGLVQTPLTQFNHQATDLAALGMVAVIAEYRVAWDGAGFSEAREDARDAVGWVRSHAAEFGLDPTKIVAAGASVGGWMAAATEAEALPQRANFLVLLDPALGGVIIQPSELYGGKGVPTIIFRPQRDATVPAEVSQRYCAAARDCQLVEWPNGAPGFFNTPTDYPAVLGEIETFLRANRLLDPR